MIKIGIIGWGAMRLAGKIAEIHVLATGEIIARIADNSGHKVLGTKTRSNSRKIRKGINSIAKVTANTTEAVVDKTVEIGTSIAVYTASKAEKVFSKAFVKDEIKIYGDSRNFYNEEKFVKVNYEVVNDGK